MRRMGQSAMTHPGWGRRRLGGGSQPRWSGRIRTPARGRATRCWAGHASPGGRGSHMSASRRSSVPAPASECRTMGERKVVCNTGCHAAPGNARNRQPRLQEKSQTRKTGRPSLRVQAAMECVGGRCDCEQSDLSQLKLFANSGERYKSLTVLPSERQLRHQRFSRVRTVAQLGNGEVKANNREIDCCASTDGCNQCVNISDF
jgi:hypothetical protein